MDVRMLKERCRKITSGFGLGLAMHSNP
jgi:hypothetical protein